MQPAAEPGESPRRCAMRRYARSYLRVETHYLGEAVLHDSAGSIVLDVEAVLQLLERAWESERIAGEQ